MIRKILFVLVIAIYAAGAQPGLYDDSFNLNGNGFNNAVNALEIQSDGKILVGGNFVEYNGVQCSGLVRLHQDGSLDTSFHFSGMNNIQRIRLDKYGRIYVSDFNKTIVRAYQDGTIDYIVNIDTLPSTLVGYSWILTFDITKSGKTIIGTGAIIDDYRNSIIPLDTNGLYDSSFNTYLGNGRVFDIVINDTLLMILNKGSYLIDNEGISTDGLSLFNINGLFLKNSKNIGLINSFCKFPNLIITNDFIYASFNLYLNEFEPNACTASYLYKFSQNVVLDSSFNRNGVGFDGSVLSLAVQEDGKILVGGNFTTYNYFNCPNIARLNPDGSLDRTFNPAGIGFNGQVNALAMQTDGKVIAGGAFGAYNGVNRSSCIARILTSGDPVKTEELDFSVDYRMNNPVNGNYLFVAPPTNDSQISCSVYNSIGNELFDLTFTGETSINVSDLPAGLYFAIFNDGSSTITKKFVKE